MEEVLPNFLAGAARTAALDGFLSVLGVCLVLVGGADAGREVVGLESKMYIRCYVRFSKTIRTGAQHTRGPRRALKIDLRLQDSHLLLHGKHLYLGGRAPLRYLGRDLRATLAKAGM